MRYEIRIVEDQKLPAGKDWMMIQSPTECFVFLRADAVCERVLAQAWSAFRAGRVRQPISA